MTLYAHERQGSGLACNIPKVEFDNSNAELRSTLIEENLLPGYSYVMGYVYSDLPFVFLKIKDDADRDFYIQRIVVQDDDSLKIKTAAHQLIEVFLTDCIRAGQAYLRKLSIHAQTALDKGETPNLDEVI